MPRPAHPKPSTIADHLEAVAERMRSAAQQVRTAAPDAIARAAVLAARGYPSATLGNGSRSVSDSTSTERAALDADDWASVDDDLARLLRGLWLRTTQEDQAVADTISLIVRVLAHASDDDPIPAGRGHCLACETFCIGDGENNRLRDGGFCHACTEAWRRWRLRHPMGMRSDFIYDRRKYLRDRGLMEPANDQAVG